MNAALLEMMRPELLESEKVGYIKGTVETLKELGFEDKEIEAKIIKSYGIDKEEAMKYLQECVLQI